MAVKNISNQFVIQQYVKSMFAKLKLMYPKAKDEQIIKVITDSVNKNFIDTNCSIQNNYTGDVMKTSLSGLMNWIKKEKPITTESGVFFKRHSQLANKDAEFVSLILNLRAEAKKKMFQYPKGHEMYVYYNRLQRVYKIFINAYYGVSGQKQSAFFNINVASSITAKGQSIISTALTTFERFLGNNVKFKSLDEFMIFVVRVLKEDYSCEGIINNNKTKEEFLDYIKDCFFNVKDFNDNYDLISDMLDDLSQDDINKLYYKNNLLEFCRNKKISILLNKIYKTTDQYITPDNPPEEIISYLNKLWNYFKTYVVYNYVDAQKINRLKNDLRKVVTTVDTDSNMLNINNWYTFCCNRFKLDRKSDNQRYTAINIMAFCLTNLIALSFSKYTKQCNLEEEPAKYVKMKNEFLFKRQVLTAGKKAYASILELQEGNIVPESDSLNIAGLSIKKTDFNREIGKTLQKILEEDILQKDKITVEGIIRKFKKLEGDIRESLSQGELRFAMPVKLSDPSSYKTPLQMQPVRGMLIYNELELGEEIKPPAECNMLKLNAKDLVQLSDLYKTDKEIYRKIKSFIYENTNKNLEGLAQYGFTNICFPKSVKKVPEWLIPYIDVETMIADAMKKGIVFLKCIGVHEIEVTKDEVFFSNIVNI